MANRSRQKIGTGTYNIGKDRDIVETDKRTDSYKARITDERIGRSVTAYMYSECSQRLIQQLGWLFTCISR